MKRVPNLRFPEFSDEWQKKQLKDFLEFKNGLNADREKFGDGIKFINVMDILNNPYLEYDMINGKVDIDENTLKNYSVKYGDILFQRSSENRVDAGKSNVYIDKENTATFGGFVIRGKKIGNYEPVFMNTLLKSRRVRKEITSKAQGAQHINVGQETLENVNIHIPSIEEQKFISNLFNKIDSRISIQQKIVNDIKEQKNGLMQKIFNQIVRFKDEDGSNYPAWKKEELRNYLKPRNQKQVPSEEAPLMAFTATEGVQPKGDRYDRSFLVKSEDKLYKRTELNDFIYSSNNLDVGSIGLNKYGVAVISDVYEIFIVKENASPIFISELIQTPKVLSQILRYRQGVMYGQYRIYADDFLSVSIPFPSLKEQQKIANCILTFDKKIENEKVILDALQKIKKGLIQQMFI